MPIRDKRAVSKTLRIPYATVHDAIRLFNEGGQTLNALLSKRGKRFKCIPEDIKKALRNDRLL